MRNLATTTLLPSNENMKKIIFLPILFLLVACGPPQIDPLSLLSEKGVEVNRPNTQPNGQEKENAAILIAVGPTGEVWMDGRRIDVRQVKANVVKMLADNPKGSVVIQADEKAVADTIIKVMDGAREAGVSAISLASEPK